MVLEKTFFTFKLIALVVIIWIYLCFLITIYDIMYYKINYHLTIQFKLFII